MITLNNKFEIGETAWTYKPVPITTECPFCKGTKSIQTLFGLVTCKNCYGTGVYKSSQTYLAPAQVKIHSIRASIHKEHTEIKYKVIPINLSDNINNRTETSIFKTEQEAQEYCKTKNEKEKNYGN